MHKLLLLVHRTTLKAITEWISKVWRFGPASRKCFSDLCFPGPFSIQCIQHCFSNFILYCGCVMLETVHYGVDCVVNHALICTRLTEVYCRVMFIHISQFCNSEVLIELREAASYCKWSLALSACLRAHIYTHTAHMYTTCTLIYLLPLSKQEETQ